ncbi:hypothetical protein ACWCY1_22325 [Streptomyces goshikiensis]
MIATAAHPHVATKGDSATLALDPTGRGRQRWNNRWKSALNEFDVLFDGRLTAGRV